MHGIAAPYSTITLLPVGLTDISKVVRWSLSFNWCSGCCIRAFNDSVISQLGSTSITLRQKLGFGKSVLHGISQYRSSRHFLFFLPRDAMLARYMRSSCVCPSVRPSVCLTQADAVPKRLNIGSRKQRRTIARELCRFLMPKISAKFQRSHPQWGAKQRCGGLK